MNNSHPILNRRAFEALESCYLLSYKVSGEFSVSLVQYQSDWYAVRQQYCLLLIVSVTHLALTRQSVGQSLG